MDRRAFVAGTFALALLATQLAAEAQGQMLASVREIPRVLTAQGGGAHPSPAQAPDEVIRVQLEALAANDDPHEDAGIEVAFRFASPANTRVTGPLARFIAMVHNALYRPLLNHRAVRYGPLRVEDDRAAQMVIVTAGDGEVVAYVFVLSRQQGGACDGCWMTDSVLRVEAEEALREERENGWL
jgi:uncharacterized protein DUF4864